MYIFIAVEDRVCNGSSVGSAWRRPTRYLYLGSDHLRCYWWILQLHLSSVSASARHDGQLLAPALVHRDTLTFHLAFR